MTSNISEMSQEELCISCQLVPGIDSDLMTLRFDKKCQCKYKCCLDCAARLDKCVYCRKTGIEPPPSEPPPSHIIIPVDISDSTIQRTCSLSINSKRVLYTLYNLSYIIFIFFTCFLFGFQMKWILLLVRCFLGLFYAIYIYVKPEVPWCRSLLLLSGFCGAIMILCLIGVETNATYYNIIYIFTELFTAIIYSYN